MSSSSSSAAAVEPVFRFGKNDLGAKEVVLKLFPDPLGTELARIAGRGKGLNWRKVLEPVDPVTQCEKAIPTEKPGSGTCYLCEQPMLDKKSFGKNYAHPLYPECEHILPVTSARWYLDLYMFKEQTKDETIAKLLSLEYAWAHRICNQTKSNDLYISEDQDKGVILLNSEAIKESLGKIRDAAKTYLTTFGSVPTPVVSAGGKTATQIVEGIAALNPDERKDSRVNAKVQAIVDHLNTYPDANSNLLTLARASCITDANVMPKDLQAAVETFYKDTALQTELTALKDDAIKTLLTKKVPEWLRDAMPKYSGDEGLTKLLAPFQVTSFKPDSEIMDMARTSLETTLPALTTKIDNALQKIPVGEVPDLLKFLSYFHYELYVSLWNSTYQYIKSRDKTVCFLRDLLDVLRKNAGTGLFTFTDPTPPLDVDTKRCEKIAAERKSIEEEAAETLDRLTTRQYERYSLEEDKVDALTDEQEVAYALINFSQGMLPPEEFLEYDASERPKIARVELLRIALKEADFRLSHPDLKDPKRKERLEKKKAIRIKERDQLIAELCETLPKKLGTAQDNAAAYRTFLERYCGAEKIENVPIGWPEYVLRNPVSVSQSSSSSNAASGQGRRTKRAKLSQHTKRAHHSGPSKKLRRRSFRKSQKGKVTKRSRY